MICVFVAASLEGSIAKETNKAAAASIKAITEKLPEIRMFINSINHYDFLIIKPNFKEHLLSEHKWPKQDN